MKRLILFCFPIIFLIGCSKDSNVLSPQEETAFKEIAYNSLTSWEKSTIVNPDIAIIVEGYYNSEDRIHKIYIDNDHIIYFALIDTTTVLIENQKLISVLFNTTQDALLGPIDVIINPLSKKAVGQTLRY